MESKSKSTLENAFDDFHLGENLKNNSTTIGATLVATAAIVGAITTVRKMNGIRLRAKRNRQILKTRKK